MNRLRVAGCLIIAVMLSASLLAQSRGATPPRPTQTPAPRTTARAPEPKVEPAMMECPSPLGTGVQTKRTFCDVLIAGDPLAGIIITLPPHTGTATLTFDLHNRHTYSEELVKNNRGFRRYTASIGVLAMDNTLLARALIQSEFRTAADLFDRISGTGPSGLKAVAPTGIESISIVVDAGEDKVSILGEKLTELRPEASAPEEFRAAGRPIAIVSNVMVRYQPAPARRPTTPTRRR